MPPTSKAITLTITGGARARRKLKETERALGDGAQLSVGFLANARYPNGIHVAQNAFWQEFGTPNAKHPIPPRPFMRMTIEKYSPQWADAFARIAKAQGYDAVKTLTLMGEGIKGQIVQSIRDLTTPALAESTVEAKGFDKPLIETALMIRSVAYEVETK